MAKVIVREGKVPLVDPISGAVTLYSKKDVPDMLADGMVPETAKEYAARTEAIEYDRPVETALRTGANAALFGIPNLLLQHYASKGYDWPREQLRESRKLVDVSPAAAVVGEVGGFASGLGPGYIAKLARKGASKFSAKASDKLLAAQAKEILTREAVEEGADLLGKKMAKRAARDAVPAAPIPTPREPLTSQGTLDLFGGVQSSIPRPLSRSDGLLQEVIMKGSQIGADRTARRAGQKAAAKMAKRDEAWARQFENTGKPKWDTPDAPERPLSQSDLAYSQAHPEVTAPSAQMGLLPKAGQIDMGFGSPIAPRPSAATDDFVEALAARAATPDKPVMYTPLSARPSPTRIRAAKAIDPLVQGLGEGGVLGSMHAWNDVTLNWDSYSAEDAVKHVASGALMGSVMGGAVNLGLLIPGAGMKWAKGVTGKIAGMGKKGWVKLPGLQSVHTEPVTLGMLKRARADKAYAADLSARFPEYSKSMREYFGKGVKKQKKTGRTDLSDDLTVGRTKGDEGYPGGWHSPEDYAKIPESTLKKIRSLTEAKMADYKAALEGYGIKIGRNESVREILSKARSGNIHAKVIADQIAELKGLSQPSILGNIVSRGISSKIGSSLGGALAGGPLGAILGYGMAEEVKQAMKALVVPKLYLKHGVKMAGEKAAKHTLPGREFAHRTARAAAVTRLSAIDAMEISSSLMGMDRESFMNRIISSIPEGLDPKVRESIVETYQRSADLLREKAPKVSPTAAYRPKRDVPTTESRKFAMYARAIAEPRVLMYELQDKKVHPETVEVWQKVYPEAYKQIVGMLEELEKATASFGMHFDLRTGTAIKTAKGEQMFTKPFMTNIHNTSKQEKPQLGGLKGGIISGQPQTQLQGSTLA
jgi:hypothetical protein